MRVTDIKLTVMQIAGNAEGTGILLNIAPGYDYVDGKRSDTQSYIRCQTVFVDNAFEKVSVKVPGTKPVVSEEQLAQQSGKLKVRFKNLTGRLYRNQNGEYALSCSADSVEVVQS